MQKKTVKKKLFERREITFEYRKIQTKLQKRKENDRFEILSKWSENVILQTIWIDSKYY